MIYRQLVPPNSSYFKRTLEIFELVLRPDDANYLQLVDYVTKLQIVSSSVTAAICRYILDYCGGHLFPTLHFIEVFFTLPEMSSHLQSMDTFFLHFHSADFAHSEYYREVQRRCFSSHPEEAAVHLHLVQPRGRARVLRGRGKRVWW